MVKSHMLQILNPLLMAFGIYIHIPYCIQRCHYCDFATYVQDQILPPKEYFKLLKKEFHQSKSLFQPQKLTSLYFGGGTPSLVPEKLLADYIQFIDQNGFTISADTEITVEVNPATLTKEKLENYRKAGINRLSVGSQTFQDQRLKELNREHSVEDTLRTLELIQKYEFNFSFDLLYALPNQTQKDFLEDLKYVEKIRPHHISPYILTLPDNHFLNQGRPEEDVQIEMFQALDEKLKSLGYQQYEISNYCLPGFHSRHNHLYWDDEDYWGIGLSAHSYLKKDWGMRFWNERNIDNYQARIKAVGTKESALETFEVPKELSEVLSMNESLTDFCHISLRKTQGLSLQKLTDKFSEPISNLVQKKLVKLIERNFIQKSEDHYQLTAKGQILSNQIFADLTFLKEDIVDVLRPGSF